MSHENTITPEQATLRSKFEGIVNCTVESPEGDAYVQIRHNDVIYNVGIVIDGQELDEVKELDDIAFGKHQGVTHDELRFLTQNGRVLTVRNDEGVLVGESQIQLNPGGLGAMFESDEAYCYGDAIRPGFEGQGYAQILYKAQEVTAREEGKRTMVLTVRAENGRGIRARLNDGFRITGYDPGKYGSVDEGGARLVMRRDLKDEPLPFIPQRQAERFINGRIPVVDGPDQRHILPWKPLEVAVPVIIGDEVDREAHENVREVLQNNYIGTGILRPDEIGADSSLLVFQQKDTLPVPDQLTFPLRVDSEYGKLREVVLSACPENDQLYDAVAINTVSQAHIGNIDTIGYKDEHIQFLRILESQGIHVVYTPALPRDHKSAIYTRDPAFTLGDTFVNGILAKETRKYEGDAFKRLTQYENAIDFSRIAPSGAIIEGGDVILLDDNKVAVGINERTNRESFETLQAAFPQYEFIDVPHPDLHLDVLFTMLGPKKALADVTQLPDNFIQMLTGDGYEIVEADPDEQKTLGCNVLAIDENIVVAAKQNASTNQRLRESGVEVIEVDMPNITKEGGGPRCITCPTNRD